MSTELRKLIESLVDTEFDEMMKEARGVAAREAGQILSDDDGTEYEIAGIRKFPGKTDAFDSSADLDDAVNVYLEMNPLDIDSEIEEVNALTADKKGALIIFLRNMENNTYSGYLKFFKNTSRGGYGKWSMAQFARDTGLKLRKGAAALEGLALKPSDLVQDENLRTVDQLVAVAKANAAAMVKAGNLPPEAGDHIGMVLDAAKRGAPSPVLPGGAKYAQAYNKYLGEVLAPISVIKNWISTGNRDASQKILLPGSSYAKCRARFFQSATNALVDSELEAPNGATVGISSKAGSGAAASVTSLFSILSGIQSTNPKAYQYLLKTHGYPISIIQTINNNNSVLGVLEAAKIMGLINDAEVKIVANLKQADPLKAVTAIRKKDRRAITPNLLKLSKLMWGKGPGEVKDAPPSYHPFFHILAGVAKAVAAQINKDDRFDKAVREILNHSAVIQVNSKIGRVNKTDAQFKEFKVVYPPNFEGKIYANASKNFFTTGIKGKLSFKIKAKAK